MNFAHFGGKKVMWNLPNNNILKQNKIYEIDNFVNLQDRIVRLNNERIVTGRLLIQVKLGKGEKSEYLPFNNFTPVNE